MIRATVILTLLVSACRSGGNDAPQPPPEPVGEPPPAAGLGDEPEPTLKEHMQGHFTAITEIERALVANDLARAKERATWLAEHRPHDAVESWEPHLDAVAEAARSLAASEDLAGAAKLAATLGNECAACHLETTAITSFPYAELPAAGSDTKSQMKRHQWAADRLWEGLIGPSELSWIQGAEILAAGEFVPQVTLPDDKRAEVAAFASKAHALGRAAVDAERSARSNLYAELLVTCSSCHAIARKR